MIPKTVVCCLKKVSPALKKCQTPTKIQCKIQDGSTGPKGSVCDIQAGPLYESQAEPEWDCQAGPVWDIQAGPVWDSQAGPVWDIQEEPELDSQTGPEFDSQQGPEWNCQAVTVFDILTGFFLSKVMLPAFIVARNRAQNDMKFPKTVIK